MLDTIENILESRTLKVNQLRDEVFDKSAELKELRATSKKFEDMYDQVVSFIRRAVHRQNKAETTTTQFKFTSNAAAIL
jgi:vacuolar-type H+-ATPase subunit I/STV1